MDVNKVSLASEDLTGLILAGGQGSRMGGQDKGLVEVNGVAMVAIALHKFKSITPHVMISANRHIERYQEFEVPVVQDDSKDYPGPLAGILSGLRQCSTKYMAVLPCDSPAISIHYVEKLYQALEKNQVEIAYLVTRDQDGEIFKEPLFALFKNKSPKSLEISLEQHLKEGQSKVLSWYKKHHVVELEYVHKDELRNINDPSELKNYLATLL